MWSLLFVKLNLVSMDNIVVVFLYILMTALCGILDNDSQIYTLSHIVTAIKI